MARDCRCEGYPLGVRHRKCHVAVAYKKKEITYASAASKLKKAETNKLNSHIRPININDFNVENEVVRPQIGPVYPYPTYLYVTIMGPFRPVIKSITVCPVSKVSLGSLFGYFFARLFVGAGRDEC